MIRRTAVSLIALALATPALAQAPALPATPIDPARLSQIDRALSTDAMEGRGPATAAEPRVIDYVVGQMKAAGLQPGGANGSWTQDVPLARFEVTGPVALSFTAGGKAQALTQGDQAVVQTLVPVNRVDIKNAPLVFCGYGVKAPELGWDDFKGVDLRGKVAVVLINDPDFEAPAGAPVAGKFGGKAETYYGRWTYKYEEAARQGALGMLIVHETAPASYGWATVKNSNGNAQFDIVRDDPTKSHALLQGWIQRDLAVDMFRKAGLSFEAEKKRAMTAGFKPVTLKGATFSASYAVNSSRIVSHNILGMLKGARRPQETVFYTAHWDHLGVGAPDARGDRIYNGAVDNADGVASILELARVFARAPRTERSVVFMSVTAEEKGLLGSEYYVTHPIYPLAKTAAVFNIDALGVAGPARDFSISGDSKSTLQDDLTAAARRDGRDFAPDAQPEAGHFFRSDHFSFAKRGVPAVSIESGDDLYVGGEAAGTAARDAYVKLRYHQPADEWSPSMDWRGAAIDLGLIYDVGRAIANAPGWPGWKPGSEFKAVRDATAGGTPGRMIETLTLAGPDAGLGAGPGAGRTAQVLEEGGLVLLPDLPFEVWPQERDLIDPAVLGGGSKNISLDPRTGVLSGSGLEGERLSALTAMTRRYAGFADALVARLAPGYAPHLKRKRTSFRPGSVGTRALSPRKDDRRLHVDAFPSSPVGGDRILRVFSNVDPGGRDRIWEVGEQGFEAFARDFAPRVRTSGGGLRSLLALTGVTRGRRTAYDQAMLDLHDRAKLDDGWQSTAPRRRIAFPAGSSWIVYTDGVLHAALEGQHAFEQTYLLPLEAMEVPARSPQRTLERVLGRPLL